MLFFTVWEQLIWMSGKQFHHEVNFLSQNTNGQGDDTEGQTLQPVCIRTQWWDKEGAQKWILRKNEAFST